MTAVSLRPTRSPLENVFLREAPGPGLFFRDPYRRPGNPRIRIAAGSVSSPNRCAGRAGGSPEIRAARLRSLCLKKNAVRFERVEILHHSLTPVRLPAKHPASPPDYDRSAHGLPLKIPARAASRIFPAILPAAFHSCRHPGELWIPSVSAPSVDGGWQRLFLHIPLFRAVQTSLLQR